MIHTRDTCRSVGVVGLLGGGLQTVWMAVWPSGVLVISARCCLAASCAQHLDMVASKVKSDSLSRSSTVSPSKRPSTIWSLMLF